jgi:hypothetical protein
MYMYALAHAYTHSKDEYYVMPRAGLHIPGSLFMHVSCMSIYRVCLGTTVNLFMSMCVFVCVYTYIHIYTYIYIYILSVNIFVYILNDKCNVCNMPRMYVCMYVCTHACIRRLTHIPSRGIPAHKHSYTYTHIHTYQH